VELGSYEWCWAPTDAPLAHYGLATPPLGGRMTTEQVEANTSVAMEELYRHLTGEALGS
jgi:hypothetical protein